MTALKRKEEKLKYERVVKLVEKARKEAIKFIQKNQQLDPQLRIRYS